MNIGVYISGLGQSFSNESIEKYATRLMNEMSFDTNGLAFYLKTEIVQLSEEKSTKKVCIYEKAEEDKIVYKLYDFQYHELLTDPFKNKSIIYNNLWLLLLVFRKSPLLLKRLLFRKNYSRPFQAIYLFIIFLIIALAVLLMLPATLSVVFGFWQEQQELIPEFLKNNGYITREFMETFSETIVTLTALLILIIPNANSLIANLATEFVCANDYLEHGSRQQSIMGNLEKLVDFISENETDCEIHFHTFSFGSVLAIDYLFPFGNKVAWNAKAYCKSLITIGTPFEFINSYYDGYFDNRKTELDEHLNWINICSIADALATSFRSDEAIGDSEYGLKNSALKPTNVNYEVAPLKKGLVSFIFLHSIRVHGMYWDKSPDGQSCLRGIYEEMKNKGLLPQMVVGG